MRARQGGNLICHKKIITFLYRITIKKIKLRLLRMLYHNDCTTTNPQHYMISSPNIKFTNECLQMEKYVIEKIYRKQKSAYQPILINKGPNLSAWENQQSGSLIIPLCLKQLFGIKTIFPVHFTIPERHFLKTLHSFVT